MGTVNENEHQAELVAALYDQGAHNNLRRAALRFTQAVVDNTSALGRGVLLIEIHRLMLRAMELAQNGGGPIVHTNKAQIAGGGDEGGVQDFGDAENAKEAQAFQSQAAAVRRAHGNGHVVSEF